MTQENNKEWKEEIIEFGDMGFLKITGIPGNVIIQSLTDKTLWNNRNIILHAVFSHINTCSVKYEKNNSDPFGKMDIEEQIEIEEMMNELYEEWIATEDSQNLLEHNKNLNKQVIIKKEDLENFHKEFLNPTDINSLNDIITNMALQTNKPNL